MLQKQLTLQDVLKISSKTRKLDLPISFRGHSLCDPLVRNKISHPSEFLLFLRNVPQKQLVISGFLLSNCDFELSQNYAKISVTQRECHISL